MTRRTRNPKIEELFLRYPGSKANLFDCIRQVFPDLAVGQLWSWRMKTYCEPFFGSGAIGWRVMRLLNPNKTRVVINDRDVGVAALWKAVRDDPKGLAAMVEAFEPTPEAFYQFKERDGERGLDTVVRGFEKLVLHQTSFSGLGVRAGGPLGGRAGASAGGAYTTDCRWRPGKIVRGIDACNRRMKLMRDFAVESRDFAEVLAGLDDDSFAYLDPPYYVQGPALYRHAFGDDDHRRLARLLIGAPFLWVLSYDDCQQVRDLYSTWAKVVSFDMTPTVSRAAGRKPRRKNRELLITPRRS